MGKVVTSQGLNEFIQSGKVEEIKAQPKPKAPETPQGSPNPQAQAKPEPNAEVPAEAKPEPSKVDEDDTYAGEDEETKAEVKKAERFDKLMRKKHRAMREAQEERAESDRFAETQFNTARMMSERAAALEAELMKLREMAKPAPEVMKKPDPQAFYNEKGEFKAFEYAEALAKWSSDQSIAEFKKQQETEKAEALRAQAEEAAKARVAETIKKHPDYQSVLEKADVKTHNAVLQYLTTSEHIGEVSYYLAQHPEFVSRINQLNPLKAIAEIGKLELAFEKPVATPDVLQPTPKASGAPAPITPLSSSLSVNTNTDPSKMTFQELRAYERSRRR